jgi:hypothetical protein
MKKIIALAAIACLFAACHAGTGKGSEPDSSAPSSSPDKTAVADDSAKAQSDSLVNAAPDTLKAK